MVREGDDLHAGAHASERRSEQGMVTVAELLGHEPGETTGQRHGAAEDPVSRGRWRRRLAWLTHRPLLLAGLVAAAVIWAVILVVSFYPGDRFPIGTSQSTAAVGWLHAYAKGPVLSDPEFGGRLREQGRPAGLVTGPDACVPRCPDDWLASTPALRAAARADRPLASALTDSTPAAVFGAGDDRIEIRRLGYLSAAQRSAELTARKVVGQALAGLPRLTADPSKRAVMSSGNVDPRVLAMIATLVQRGPVRLLDLPEVPGEDAAGQPRRQLLLEMPTSGSGELRSFFAAQTGPYRPDSIAPLGGGLLVVYPPMPPAHLLDAFGGGG
jgi:hypothetical protein